MISNTYHEELLFSEDKFANLIFLPIKINHKREIAFFDTGANISFIKESLAKKLGLKESKEIMRGGNNNGGKFEFTTDIIENINIGAINISNVVVGIIPDECFEFGADNEGNNFPASMILGWDLISQFCWNFDMSTRKVAIQNGGIMPLSDFMHWDNFVIIDTKYNSEKIPMGFDSGHTDTMLDITWLNRIKTFHKAAISIVGIGSNKDENVSIVENLTIEVSDIEIVLNNIEILEHSIWGANESSLFGLLGADILSDRKWIIDGKSNYFKIIN